jgi:RimJ/RimL family protein N-acetyltransferase
MTTKRMTTNAPLHLTTPRLLLRQWRVSDREPFAALNADPDVMAFFPAPLSPASSDTLAGRCEQAIRDRGWGLWAVELRGTGDFIGFVGLSHAPEDLPIAPCIEIGWRLAKPFWKQGLATEAAREVLRVGFGVLGFAEIVSFTAVSNLPSRAVMERLGMLPDAATFEHPRVPAGNPLRTHCVYRLSRPA